MSDINPHENTSLSREERTADIEFDYNSQAKEPVRICNLCGAQQWSVLTEYDRYGYSAHTTACVACSLAVLNPRMTAAAYSAFYESIYRPLVSAYYGRRIDAKTVQEEQWDYAAEMEAFVAPHLTDLWGASFLDVGGSTGIVSVHFAKCFGLVPTVLDPAPDEIEEAKALGIETVTALVENWDPGEMRYQVIGLFQTIDHLLDVAATLKKLRSFIAEDGLFLVDVVDFRHVYRKNGSLESATKIDHPYSLTEETAECFFEQCGFHFIAKRRSNDGHLMAYVCAPAKPRPDARPTPEAVSRFFNEVRTIRSELKKEGGKA